MYCAWAISVGLRRNWISINESWCVRFILTCSNTRLGPHVHPIMAPVLTVTSPLDPRTAAAMSPAENSSSFFIIIIILSTERFFRNMFPFFFLHFFFSLSFLPGLSIFVASVRYKWWPSGDLPYTRCFFFWQTSLKYTFQPPSIQATYGTRTLNCEPSIYFSTKEHPSYSFLFSCLLLYVQ